MRELGFYYLIRFLTFPFRWMPLFSIRLFGKIVGYLGFYCLSTYRKRALSNLALATKLQLNPKQILRTAKESFQNLAITCLEYPKLASIQDLSSFVQCENPEVANALYAKGQGIIFFCAHQANWEVLFLDGTYRMKGIAIGKSIKNKRLYQWILSIRERYGGRIIEPYHAMREGFKALKRGKFLGIVGDQGMPSSHYSYPFLGRTAWTSTAPALLAYRTQSPLIFAETRRTSNGYKIRYADPIWPNVEKPIETEIPRIMNEALSLLEKSIQTLPGQWLWQHNRWKQQTPHNISRRFRHDCLAVILPADPLLFTNIAPHLSIFREIYPTEFISLLIPDEHHSKKIPFDPTEIIYYRGAPLKDFRFKLVFNFTNNPKIASHFLKQSAFEVLNLKDLERLASPHLLAHEKGNFSAIVKRALYRSKAKIISKIDEP